MAYIKQNLFCLEQDYTAIQSTTKRITRLELVPSDWKSEMLTITPYTQIYKFDVLTSNTQAYLIKDAPVGLEPIPSNLLFE